MTIRRSNFVCSLLLTAFAAPLATAAEKPNVIIVFADDQGYQPVQRMCTSRGSEMAHLIV